MDEHHRVEHHGEARHVGAHAFQCAARLKEQRRIREQAEAQGGLGRRGRGKAAHDQHGGALRIARDQPHRHDRARWIEARAVAFRGKHEPLQLALCASELGEKLGIRRPAKVLFPERLRRILWSSVASQQRCLRACAERERDLQKLRPELPRRVGENPQRFQPLKGSAQRFIDAGAAEEYWTDLGSAAAGDPPRRPRYAARQKGSTWRSECEHQPDRSSSEQSRPAPAFPPRPPMISIDTRGAGSLSPCLIFLPPNERACL